MLLLHINRVSYMGIPSSPSYLTLSNLDRLTFLHRLDCEWYIHIFAGNISIIVDVTLMREEGVTF